MTNLTIRESVEMFHLLFLSHFAQKIDKRLYCLKGGCNLRFFLRSIRYSEDIDIDIQTVARNTLENLVNKLLESQPFTQLLQSKQLKIVNISTPKQTATTQRWKIQLMSTATSLPINTKIEFSRRDKFSGIDFDYIDKLIVNHYQIRPILLSHYSIDLAFQQKINALINRTQTQARDVFDLHHLSSINQNLDNIKISKSDLETAIENAMNLTFAEFKSQVVAYLEPSFQTQYNDQKVWDNILLSLNTELMALLK